MTSDLFDDAKPVRNATMVELIRAFDDDIPEFVRDGHALGVHLTSLLIAFSCLRLKLTSGQVAAPHLQEMVAIAIGQLLGHAAGAYRPIRNGVPLTPVQNLPLLVSMVAAHALQHANHCETGTQDFVVPFRLNAEGALEPEPFDIRDFLKGGAK